MHLLNTLRPTAFQKQVIAKIAAAATPKLAASEISKTQHLKAARDMLAKLGVITFTDTEAVLTQKGAQLAQEENLVDQSGQLTDEGNKFAFADQQQQTQQGQEQPPADPLGGGLGDPNLESFALLRDLLV